MVNLKIRNLLTLKQKIMTIEGISSEECQRTLASRFCSSKSQTQRLWTVRRSMNKLWADDAIKDIKFVPLSNKFQMGNDCVLDWYGNVTARGFTIVLKTI